MYIVMRVDCRTREYRPRIFERTLTVVRIALYRIFVRVDFIMSICSRRIAHVDLITSTCSRGRVYADLLMSCNHLDIRACGDVCAIPIRIISV